MLMNLLITLGLLVICFILWGHYFVVRRMKNVPGPKEYFLLGSAFELFVSPVELFTATRKWAKQFPNIYKFMAFNVVTLNIFDPEDIEKVLSTTKHNEKGITYNFLISWLQDGLLLSKGQKWQDRRKILTPSFHFSILRKFCVVFGEVGQRMVENVQQNIGVPVDVIPIISEFTLAATCETAMGTSLKSDNVKWKTYKRAVFKLSECFIQRLTKIPLYPEGIYRLTPYWWQQKKVLNDLHGFTRKVIQDRKEYLKSDKDPKQTDFRNKKHTPMLDLLIAAEKEGLINERGIQEEVDTFMFEGHDTTASGLVFCFMALAQNENIQENIVLELNTIFGDSTRLPSIEDLNQMGYLERCIKESLRLYPPVPFISRYTSEEIMLSGHKVPTGTMCNVHIYDLHRREDLYPNPELFDPDRFLPNNCIGRHPYAYLPFSAGPRNCIGQRFAMLLMKAILSSILRRYKLLPVTTPADIVPSIDIIFRNSNPVRVMFGDRK